MQCESLLIQSSTSNSHLNAKYFHLPRLLIMHVIQMSPSIPLCQLIVFIGDYKD